MNTVMELLDSEYQDCEIRNFALKHLQKYKTDQILLYSKQIVQCLKFEKDCQLIEFIIDLCITDFPNFGFYLYWDIFYEAAHSFNCKALYEQILKIILGNVSYADRQDLEFSAVIIRQLSAINQCPGGESESDI